MLGLIRLLTANSFSFGWLILSGFLVGMLYTRFIYLIYPFKKLLDIIIPYKTEADINNFPSGLVIVPSLLRDEFDFNEIIRAVDSCATNNYPGELYIIASADGRTENPEQFQKLSDWMNTQKYPTNIHLFVASNEVRRGKLMAIYSAIDYIKELIVQKKIESLPKIYFSVDADETISDGSLQKLVERLMTRHWISRNYRRVVQGQICINKGDMWKGWKSFFTVAGQNYLFVARNFFNFSPMQENINILPMPILCGQLYASWTEQIVESARLMGYFQTIKFSNWLKWWCGKSLPKFSEYKGESLPQALCGNTDDSSLSVTFAMSHWKNGKLSWDAPATPFHAFGRMLWDLFIERVMVFEQEAKVYTFTPPTLKGLWKQRVRWMACRVEVSGRMFRGFLFYWSIAIPFFTDYIRAVFWSSQTVIWYVMIPFVLYGHLSYINTVIFMFIISYIFQFIFISMAYIFEPKKKQFTHLWLTSLVPISHIFMAIFYSGTMFYGVCEDILLFGCNVKFYPSRTLIESRAQRIAIIYRVRRFISLCWRSIKYGDVPLGWWWLGWYEKPEYGLTNGFTGWTKETKSDYILR